MKTLPQTFLHCRPVGERDQFALFYVLITGGDLQRLLQEPASFAQIIVDIAKDAECKLNYGHDSVSATAIIAGNACVFNNLTDLKEMAEAFAEILRKRLCVAVEIVMPPGAEVIELNRSAA